MNVQFSLELAQKFYASEEQFPIDFDDAYQWLGYTRRDNAFASFSSWFVEGEDFSSFARESSGGRPSKGYRLTVNCFKEWGMISKTDQGKLIRKYFLECERIVKQLLQENSQPKPVYLPFIAQTEKAIELVERYRAAIGEPNPTMLQTFKDLIGNTMIDANQDVLKPDSQEDWLGVVNFAKREFNFVCPKKGEFRDTALGTWIRFYYPYLSDKQEQRLCNETQQDIYVYPIHLCKQELREAVEAFINHPCPGTQLKNDGAFKRKKK